ncbi:MAG: hypothetical protein V4560_02180 [Bacteroidota bacterium]
MKLITAFLFCLFMVMTAHAQSTLKGLVMEIRTDIQLSGIKVENVTQHNTVNTDPHGSFTIRANRGDILCFSGLNYIPDTLYLTSLKYLTVQLELRQNALKEVKITGNEVNASAFKYEPATGPLGSHTVLYKPGGGLLFKISDSHKEAKKIAKLAELEVNGQKEREITSAFNKTMLKNYIPISGQEMDNFVIKYRPDSKTFSSSNFSLIDYVSECYKDFLKIPAEKRKSVMYPQLNLCKIIK